MIAAGYTISARKRHAGGLVTYRASAQEALRAACAYKAEGATSIRIRQDYGSVYTLDEFSALHGGEGRDGRNR